MAAHIRVLSYLPGEIVPNEVKKTDAFLQAVGALCGQITTAMAGFEDENAIWDWDWNMKRVADVCEDHLQYVVGEERLALAGSFISTYRAAFTPEVLDAL